MFGLWTCTPTDQGNRGFFSRSDEKKYVWKYQQQKKKQITRRHLGVSHRWTRRSAEHPLGNLCGLLRRQLLDLLRATLLGPAGSQSKRRPWQAVTWRRPSCVYMVPTLSLARSGFFRQSLGGETPNAVKTSFLGHPNLFFHNKILPIRS